MRKSWKKKEKKPVTLVFIDNFVNLTSNIPTKRINNNTIQHQNTTLASWPWSYFWSRVMALSQYPRKNRGQIRAPSTIFKLVYRQNGHCQSKRQRDEKEKEKKETQEMENELRRRRYEMEIRNHRKSLSHVQSRDWIWISNVVNSSRPPVAWKRSYSCTPFPNPFSLSFSRMYCTYMK